MYVIDREIGELERLESPEDEMKTDGKGIPISEMKTKFIILCVIVFPCFQSTLSKYELCLLFGRLK